MESDNKVLVNLKKVPLASEREENKKKRIKVFRTILICLLCFILGCGTGIFVYTKLHPTYKTNISSTIGELEYIFKNIWLYSDEHEDLINEMENKALYGMSEFEEDPYTSYMSKQEMEEFSNSINRDYVGIGVQYYKNGTLAIVSRVFKDSPADKGGILPGDIIRKIDGVDISDVDNDGIKELVLGEVGTKVTITVGRESTDLDLIITRDTISNTVYSYVEDDYVVLQINSFGEGTSKECASYLDDCSDYKKIIIDIRSNTGGYQTSVQEVCGLFIGPNKVYLKQKDKYGNELDSLTVSSKQYDFDNIVILINESTASAAEVFAICLKEQLPNVTLVGETTYGKGVIQTNRVLNDGGIIKITSYYWYSPNGVSINNEGVQPDIEVMMPDVYYLTYLPLDEDETYEYDSVSDAARIVQMCLKFLDYDIDRTDGYFDKNLESILIQYQKDKNIEANGIIDSNTFEMIVSDAASELYNNADKDYQLVKAKEIINGD